MKRLVRHGAATVFVCVIAGCGIPDTGVIDVGPPAVTVSGDVTVFYIDHSNAVVPLRISPDSSSVDTDPVALLFDPAAVDLPVHGLRSEVPVLKDPPRLLHEDSVTTVVLPPGAPALSALAHRQIACTAAADRGNHADDHPASTTVVTDGIGVDVRC
jgi:hypothetical protein